MENLYTYEGKQINDYEMFSENMSCQRFYDDASGTEYYLTTVYQKRTDGATQKPFLRSKITSPTTVYQITKNEGWLLGINATSNKQFTIENGISVGNQTTPTRPPLVIYSDGHMSYLDMADASGVPTGIISACVGWCPIIVNYADFADYDYLCIDGSTDVTTIHAQRQIIGEFGNGDYAIITSEGRDFNNSIGFTFAEARAVCKKHNIKFAYMLDGGGSTQLVLSEKNMNLVYEGTTGRNIWTAIVFNGKDTFAIPNN